MTEPTDLTPDEALALDVALGALGRSERVEAELRLRRDPAFAAAVDRWRATLSPLDELVAPADPPSQLWDRIEAEVTPQRTAARIVTAPSGGVLGWWKALAFGASAVAAVSLALLVARPDPEPVRVPAVVPERPAPGELLSAAMAGTGDDKQVLITATFDPDRGALILTPAAEDASGGLTPELWVIAENKPPRSLGTIGLTGPQTLRISPAVRAELKAGATLAMSLEPAGGSPTGTPTGPVVATGPLASI